MMAVRRQTQILAELEHLAGRRVGSMARDYRRAVIGPLVGRIKRAKSLKGLLRQLGPGLLGEMRSEAFEQAIADNEVQSALIGRVSAMPGEGIKRPGRTES